MSRTFTTVVPCEVGCHIETKDLLAEVLFSYTPASRAYGGYSAPTPPDPAEINDIEVVAIRHEPTGELLTPPKWLREFIANAVDQDALAELAEVHLSVEREMAMEMRGDR